MLFSKEIIQTVAEKIRDYKWEKVVIDPVMIAKGGAPLLKKEAVSALKEYLLPIAYCITPNIPEAEELTGIKINTLEDKKAAAKVIYQQGVKYVMIKGGHDDESDEAVDLLYDGQNFSTFKSKRFHTKNTHGTGCTFSAAITAELAKGSSIYDAVQIAKQFISAAIEDDLQIGKGHGPTNHWAYSRRSVVLK